MSPSTMKMLRSMRKLIEEYMVFRKRRIDWIVKHARSALLQGRLPRRYLRTLHERLIVDGGLLKVF
jgi:hypothetical protein